MTQQAPTARAEATVLRHAWLIAGILIALHVTLAWLARGPGIFSDQAVYVSLARSLRELHYREQFRIDLPIHRMYPPGYPLLLAIWSAIGGERFDWLVLVGIASSAGALLLFFSAVRTIWGSAVGLAALLALSVNPALIATSGWLLSEPPFILFESLALWAVVSGSAPRRGALIAGAGAIAAALTRSAGVVLVVALVAYWAWNRHYRRALVFGAIATAIVGGWIVFTAAAPEQVPGSSYIADAMVRPRGDSLIQAIGDRASRKLPYVQHIYWQLPVAGVPGTPVDNIIGMPIAAVAILVGTGFLYRQWAAAAFYLAAYGALLIVWPWTVGRFITPVVPWIVLAASLGVGEVVSKVRPLWRTRALVVFACLLTLFGVASVLTSIRRNQPCHRAANLPSRQCLDQRWSDFFAAVDYVRARVAQDAALVSSAPATLYLHTGRRVVSVPQTLRQRPAEFVEFLRSRHAAYILLSAVTSAPGDLVKANCHELQLEASFGPSAYLFRVPRRGESVDTVPGCQAADRFVALYAR